MEKFTLDGAQKGRMLSSHVDVASRFFGRRDFSFLEPKADHQNRPMDIDPERGFIWTCRALSAILSSAPATASAT
ncbi:DNA repair helicase RAD25 [Sporothrix curviconia]|uniref:DNA repair helicase RAD25 n=1 Tax=Sporothrix curviconia TaxID=1260050 RepID=A0ABP0BMS6_9PEZI